MSAANAARKQRVRRVYPLPEAVEPGEWKIHDGVGSTNLLARHMDVPLGDDPASAWVRLHEMAHVTWSPEQAPLASDVHLLATEDARVNLLLARSALDTTTGYEDLGPAVKARAHYDPGIAALIAVAAAGTSDAAETVKALPAELRRIVRVARRMIEKDVRDPASAVRAAEWLREHLPEVRGPSKGFCAHEHKLCASETTTGGGAPEAGEGQAWAPDEAIASLYGNERLKGKVPALFVKGPSAPWGTMEVRTPPLPARLPRAAGHGKWRPSDSGALPWRMERWATDKGVFSTRGRQRGGTVLIDASGSMNISGAAILRCVLAAPAATVAMYSCCCANVASERHSRGALVVLAQRGRRVATVKQTCVGNVVDGPALRWLGSQRMPRLWVSDGVVTGVGDHSAAELVREAADLCKHFAVRRVAKLNDAVSVLQRGGR